MPTATEHTVDEHFAKAAQSVKAIYDRIVQAARQLGPVIEDPKKTSIHLVRKTAFAGVVTRKAALVLTLKSAVDIRSSRIGRHEQASAHRWHLEVRLDNPAQVDAELLKWLSASYAESD